MPGTPLPMLPAGPGLAGPRLDSTAEQRAALPVVLVCMPFLDATRPSIQLGLLKAITAAHGFDVRTLHANLDFATRIGADHYLTLSEHRGRLLGDWLFAVEAFGDAAPDPEGWLLDDVADDLRYVGGSRQEVRDRLLHTRDSDVPAYLDHLLDAVQWDGVRVVGFTSTFQQNTASFAFARRLRQRYPDIVTVFGGFNTRYKAQPPSPNASTISAAMRIARPTRLFCGSSSSDSPSSRSSGGRTVGGPAT